MRTEKEILQIYRLFGYFNDGKTLNQEYRRGVLDALAFVQGYHDLIDPVRLKEVCENIIKESDDKQTKARLLKGEKGGFCGN